MKDTPYRWRMTAKAVLAFAIRGQRNCEERMGVIKDDPERWEEYCHASNMKWELRHVEERIKAELDAMK